MRPNNCLSAKGVSCLIFGFSVIAASALAQQSPDSLPSGPFDFSRARSTEPQSYELETKVVHFSPSAKRTGSEIYRLRLDSNPLRGPDRKGIKYTCREFVLQIGDSEPVSIPALEGWSYVLSEAASGLDEHGQVFGIDHAKFENLVDSNGNRLPPQHAYPVYNTFIDFHTFCNNFAEPAPDGRGIQHLKNIGDRIVHVSANSEPPVNLGSNVGEGSTFKNGEITLELKGVSLVDDKACAIIGFDSGESYFEMNMEPMPSMKMRTHGRSRYEGDIYVDLESMWVRKVTMREVVVSETNLPTPPNKINAITERSLTIRAKGASSP